MSDTLFAYGTLRPGHAPDEIAPAVEKLRRVGEGFVTGVLYDLGNYPGAVLDPSSTQKILAPCFTCLKMRIFSIGWMRMRASIPLRRSGASSCANSTL